MRKIFTFLLLASTFVIATGCGGGGDSVNTPKADENTKLGKPGVPDSPPPPPKYTGK